MLTISDELSTISLGAHTCYRNLTVIPLLRPGVQGEPGYLLADEAIASGTARVTELNGGTVPELRFGNYGDIPVLLVDGEELIGAKQNRTLNVTILVPAKTSITIPVSCVEAGRWSMQDAEFRPVNEMLFSSLRAARTAQVSASMRQSGTRHSDQHAVWESINAMADNLDASSPTGAMSALYQRHAATIDDYTRAFDWQEGQAGAVFALGGRPFGLDLFDHPRTMQKLFPKLIRSYALDALERRDASKAAAPEAVATLLQDVKLSVPSYAAAIGIGKDIRLAGHGVSGAALWADNRYVHLCAFRTPGTGTVPGAAIPSMERPSRRWRRL